MGGNANSQRTELAEVIALLRSIDEKLSTIASNTGSGSMSFAEALKAMHGGKTVRRGPWGQPYRFKDGDVVQGAGSGSQSRAYFASWDVLANDWEVVP